MNKYILAAGAISVGAYMVPGIVSAYRGDPNVHGPNYSEERHDAISKALENGDYKTWASAMQGRGLASRVEARDFGKVQEMHKLQLAGDTDGAARIRAELGLGQRNGSGAGQGNGYGKNR